MEFKEFLYFKGDRSYIHSSNIFDSILANKQIRDLKKIDFSLSRTTVKTWHFVTDQAQATQGRIIGQYKDDDSVYFLLESDYDITARRPYDEQGLVECFSIQGKEVEVPDHIDDYSFIEKVNAAFKTLLKQSVFSDEPLVRYLFVRITLEYIPPNAFTIRYKRKVAGKFLEGEILEQGRGVGFIYFLGN